MTSAVVQDRDEPDELQLLSCGDPIFVLDQCKEFWDAEQDTIHPLHASTRQVPPPLAPFSGDVSETRTLPAAIMGDLSTMAPPRSAYLCAGLHSSTQSVSAGFVGSYI